MKVERSCEEEEEEEMIGGRTALLFPPLASSESSETILNTDPFKGTDQSLYYL